MNEQWKRLIEAERRLLRLESTLHRTNNAITGVQSAIRNDSYNVPNPFGSGGGGGGAGGVHRFPITFDMWVEWTTEPALITGASSNVPADGPALAEAVDILAAGFTLNAANEDTGRINEFLYDTHSSKAAMFVNLEFQSTTTVSGRTEYWNADFKLAYFSDGMFLADAQQPTYSGALFQGSIPPETVSSSTIRMNVAWPRRNGVGTYIGSSTITARRNVGSTSSFDFGPTYGETGVWSFAMSCSATTYSTAGTGTIFLRWGEAVATPFVAGGTPGSLPSDFIEGGTPGSLPSDFIEGGSY